MNQLLFEKSRPGRYNQLIPSCDLPPQLPADELLRQTPPRLPELAESDLDRHYTELAAKTFGVNKGFYPLGSCTMKYNPKINEELATLPGFTGLHPLQDEADIQGALAVLSLAEQYLCEITGMDGMTFQPAAGAHGEFTGILMIKAYHAARGDSKRNKIIVPDSAHGTNPASAHMNGYQVVNILSDANGNTDLEALKAALGDDTAGLMFTNPNTLGMFDENILEITRLVHQAGGLNYYDGANLNAVMGVVRPGDMGFDVVHLNLHKTFSTPHGGGGPGSGAVGCKEILRPFLPGPLVVREGDTYALHEAPDTSIGKVKSFYGNFLVTLRALCYILSLGNSGIREAAENAVLNANYLRQGLADLYDIAGGQICMHEFVLNLERLKQETGVNATDIAKGLIDHGIHPPTMYFPLIVPEALMVEPTETESRETLDAAIAAFRALHAQAHQDPQSLHQAPQSTPIRRPDETQAARQPILHYQWPAE